MRPKGWLQEFVRVHESQLRENEVPVAYRDVTVDAIPHEAFKKATKGYLKNFWDLAEQGRAPAFLGRAGAGKTFSAACIALSVRRALIDVAFVRCGVELQELERRRFDPWCNDRLNWLGAAPFLVLDDINKARPNSFAMDMLDGIIERRYSDGLPTLYTGNLVITKTNDSELVDQFGVGSARRIREMASGLISVATKG
jgi:DNA replication protein DnaC